MKKMEISGEKIEKMLKKHYRKAERAVRPAPVALPVGESGAVVRFRPSGASRIASAAAFALCGLGIVSMVILFALSGNGFGSKLKPNPAGYQPSESQTDPQTDPKIDPSDIRYAHFDYKDYYFNGTNEGTEEFLALLAAEKGDESILEASCANVTTDLVREKMGIELFSVYCGPYLDDPESPGNLYNGCYYLKDGKPIRCLQAIALGCCLPCDFDGDGNYDLLYADTFFGSGVTESSVWMTNLETGEDTRLLDGPIYSIYIITPVEPFDGQNFTVWNTLLNTSYIYYEAGRITAEDGQPKVTIYDLDPSTLTPPSSIADVRYERFEEDWIQNRSDRGVEEFLAKLAEEYGDDTILNAECYNITNDLVREKTGVEIFYVVSTPGSLHQGLCGYYFQKEGKIFFSNGGYGYEYVSVLPCDFDGDGNYEFLTSQIIGSGVCCASIGILYPESGETKFLSYSYYSSRFIITPDEPFDGKNFTVWNWTFKNDLYYEVGRITSENGQPKVEIDENLKYDPPLGGSTDDPDVTQPRPDTSKPQTTEPKPETTKPQTTAPKPDTSKPFTPQPTTPEPTLPPDIAALPENVLEDLDAYIQKYLEQTLASACQYDHFKLIGHYGDCYVFLNAAGMRTQMEERIIVDGYRFSYYAGFDVLVHNNGKIYGLDQAFENGLLTHAQMGEINADYRAKVDGCMPSVWGIDMPSAELVNEIEQAWCDHGDGDTVFWLSDLRYYGAYGSGAVIYGRDWQAKDFTLRIADSVFELDYGSLWYYQDGTLTELSAAYENGWLTADQIAEIAAYHANYPD